MKYDYLTLDWDYYMLSMITKHKVAIIELLKSTCTHVKILDTKKGLNLIAKFKEPQELASLLLLRLYCFDDIFRVRNEISKDLDNQPHRINRIWLVKDGHEKTTLFDSEVQHVNVALFDHLLGIIEGKRPVKNNEVNKK